MSKATDKIANPPPSSGSYSSSRNLEDEEDYEDFVVCPTTPDKCECSGPCIHNSELILKQNKNDLVNMCSIYVSHEKEDHYDLFTIGSQIE